MYTCEHWKTLFQKSVKFSREGSSEHDPDEEVEAISCIFSGVMEVESLCLFYSVFQMEKDAVLELVLGELHQILFPRPCHLNIFYSIPLGFRCVG